MTDWFYEIEGVISDIQAGQVNDVDVRTLQRVQVEIDLLRRIGKNLLRWAEKLDEDLPLSCQQFWAKDIEEARAALSVIQQSDTEEKT